MSTWSPSDSETLYNVPNWGGGYFRVDNRGHVSATPEGADGSSIDLFELIGQIRRRGISTPVLLRFDAILRARVRELDEAFERAREEYGYPGGYRCVYPIKVNQQRHVVEAMLAEGRGRGMGLEVGSKPELLAAVALTGGDDSILICNGYKDAEYVETALLASRLALQPILVVEKPSELQTILDVAGRLDIRPTIGVRAKLIGRGAGRWMESGGDRSKFGLTARQIVELVEVLRKAQRLDWLQLVHFHIGSQVTDIRAIKNALREATRVTVDLIGMGAPIRWFDAGGGLGVDYDGSRTNFQSSVNYSLQEYANDVVYTLAEGFQDLDALPPEIVTESGRALTAHHAVLVTEVLGVTDFTSGPEPGPPEPDEHELIHQIAEVAAGVNEKGFQESYHDAVQIRDEAMMLFNVGQLALTQRARVEEVFWITCDRILAITRRLEYVPDDLAHLERDMADTYFLNFSIFQSLPDAWAVEQLFPILPLQRLDEEPRRHAVLADITCDSDGKLDRFIDLRDVKRTLELHPLRPDEPYYLGFFLVGAYQEILGDMHNLFGDPNIVHVDVDDVGRPRLTHVVRGDRVQEVLSYVEHFEGDMLRELRASIEKALADERMTYEESARLQRNFEAGLASYTYLERQSPRAESDVLPRAEPAPASSEPLEDARPPARA